MHSLKDSITWIRQHGAIRLELLKTQDQTHVHKYNFLTQLIRVTCMNALMPQGHAIQSVYTDVASSVVSGTTTERLDPDIINSSLILIFP